MSIPAAVAMLLLFVVAVAAVGYPFAGAAGYVGLIFFRPQDNIGELVAFHPVALILLPTIAGLALQWGSLEVRRLAVLLPVAALVGAFSLSAVFSVNPVTSLGTVLEVAKLALGMAVIVLCVHREIHLRVMLLVIAVSLAILALQGIVNSAIGVNIWKTGGVMGPGPLRGLYGNTNSFALVMVLGLVTWWYWYRTLDNIPARLVSLLLAACCMEAVVLTFSRAGLVLLFVMLLLILFMDRARIAVLALLAAGAVMVATAPSGYEQRVESIVTGNDYDHSVKRRFVPWEAGGIMVRDKPVLGVGPGNFLDEYQRLRPGLDEYKTPHNTFLEVLSETGVLGLAAYIWMIGGALGGMAVAWWRLRNETEARTASLALLLTILTFLGFGVAHGSPFFPPLMVILGLAAAHLQNHGLAGFIQDRLVQAVRRRVQ